MTADTWAAIAVTAITVPYLAFAAVLALAGRAHRRRQAKEEHGDD